MVREHRLRAQGTRPGRRAADGGAGLLQHLLPDDPRPRHRPCGRDRQARPRRPEPRLLRGLRVRGERHQHPPRPPLLGRDGQALAQDDHRPLERLPRLDHGRRQPWRDEADPRPRRQDRRDRAHRPALLVGRGRRHDRRRLRHRPRAGPGEEDPRGRARQRGRLHRRADPGRAGDRAAAHLLGRDPAHLRPLRHPADRG